MDTTKKPFIREKEMLADITGYSKRTIEAVFSGERDESDAGRVILKAWEDLSTIQEATQQAAIEILKKKHHRDQN